MDFWQTRIVKRAIFIKISKVTKSASMGSFGQNDPKIMFKMISAKNKRNPTSL
jgi:hypothetical protein